jgi:hypothetical protein
MFDSIHDYLRQLKKELKGSDPALIQDALSDAEEHLRTALENIPNKTEKEALQAVIEKYGSPLDTASAYRDMEIRIFPRPAPSGKEESQGFLKKLFGIMGDTRAWGAFLYLFLSFATGLILGGWAILGSIVSLVSLIFIIGLPIAGLFLLSVHGASVIEGRVIEALLGVRMPRRPIFVNKNMDVIDKFKSLISGSHTWKSLIYLILMFPLGILYALLSAGLLVFSLGFIISPFMELVLHLPLELFGTDTFTPVWFLPIVSLAGFFLLPLSLHIIKHLGKIHGRYAKYMLVKEYSEKKEGEKNDN